MNIPFENLAKIDEILNLLKNQQTETIEKRWLNINETASYLGYSTDRIHKLKGDSFIEGLHFYKRSGKLLFDKIILDKWVLGIDRLNYQNNSIDIESKVDEILGGLSLSQKS